MNFEEKIIAYIDILGFKGLVKAAENGQGICLSELLELVKSLGTNEDIEKFKNGPTLCPESKYLQKDLNFELTQVSDCVVVSSEISPAGVINLISHSWGAVYKLLFRGIMCRGYITRGLIYHKGTQVIGSGYQNAHSKETNVKAFKHEADERGTPFVEIDPDVCSYVRDRGDSCVKKMFSRLTREEKGTVAVFPFAQLSHSFIIEGFGHTFDPQKEKESNQNIRNILITLKDRVMQYVDKSKPDAVIKAGHYISALNHQLEVVNRTDDVIDQWS